MFETFALTDRTDYGQFLVAHAAALIPIEESLERAGASRLFQDWTDRRRSRLLLQDLAGLDLPVPDIDQAPSYASDAEAIGGLYVLEGSRLGAAVLVRRVGDHLPRAFLGAKSGPGDWRRFLAGLEQKLETDVQRSQAERAALATFHCFDKAARKAMASL
jgi:heme oxygenase